MRVVQRIFRVVFAVVGLFTLCVLGLAQFGPLKPVIEEALQNQTFFYVMLACFVLTAIGFVVNLILGLNGPKKSDVIEVNHLDGGTVQITREAVASLAKRIIEADDTCLAEKVEVSAKKKGNIRVSAQVKPKVTLDVMAKSAQLNEELYRGLASLCGDKLSGVSLQFTTPKTEQYSATVADPALESATSVEQAIPVEGYVEVESSALPEADVVDVEPAEVAGAADDTDVPEG